MTFGIFPKFNFPNYWNKVCIVVIQIPLIEEDLREILPCRKTTENISVFKHQKITIPHGSFKGVPIANIFTLRRTEPTFNL